MNEYSNCYCILQDGRFLDSCVVLGANSSYSASEDDHVVLKYEDGPPENTLRNIQVTELQNTENRKPSEFIIELQVMLVASFHPGTPFVL